MNQAAGEAPGDWGSATIWPLHSQAGLWLVDALPDEQQPWSRLTDSAARAAPQQQGPARSTRTANRATIRCAAAFTSATYTRQRGLSSRLVRP